MAIVLLLLLAVAYNYLVCRQLNTRYSTVSSILFFPFSGYLSRLQQSLKKDGDSLEFLVKERRPGQKFLITNIATFPYVILYDCQLVQEYLQRHQEFTKENRFLFSECLQKNLVSQEGEAWKRQRKLLSHVLNYDFFDMINPTIARIVDSAFAEIKPDEPLRVNKVCFKITMQTITHSFFSKDMNALTVKGRPIIPLLKDIICYCFMKSLTTSYFVRKLIMLILRLDSIPTSKWGLFLSKQEQETLEALKTVKSVIQDQVNERMEEVRRGNKGPSDFLGYYLQSYLSKENQESKQIVMEEILQQFCILLLAGTDNTSGLATSCVYCLAKYPEEYSKLERLINELPDCPSLKDISSITYLTYFIKEVSRFHPSVSDLFPRRTLKDVKIGGYEFPKNTFFGVGIKVILRDPEVFINPDEFNPERWSSPGITRYSYVAFSAGPRSCIGEQLAMLEIKQILIHTIRKFRLELNPEVPMRMLLQTFNTCVDDRLVIPRLKQ